MEYFDIALFSPPTRMLNHYRPPVSLIYLGGFLTYKGLKVKVIDTPIKDIVRDKKFNTNFNQIVADISKQMMDEFKKINTKIIGITCYSTEFDEVVMLIKNIKRINPKVLVIVGGIHPTFAPMDFFEEDIGVDICVVGEGEITLYELVQYFLNDSKRSLENIEGIVFKDEITKELKTTPARHLAENLDDISFPDCSLIDTNYYTNASAYSIRGCYLRSMYILATRGCSSQCVFCVAKKLRECMGEGKSVRIRSASSLINEIKELKNDYKIDAFYFIDDMFTVDKKNVNEFCHKLKEEKLDLLWGCSSRVSTLDEELIRKMASSRCIQIDFGVERGSDEALRLIKKGITVKKTIEIFDLCHKYGIRTFANMLINLPGETEQDLADILSLLDRIKPEVVYFNIFLPFPGTEIYENLPNKFKKEEYQLFSQDIRFLFKRYPERFKFATHNLDLRAWQSKNYRRYNTALRNGGFYFNFIYWRTLFKSKRRMNYITQFCLFIKELINQKLNS